jgi:peptidyl-prolyl cis-trans isomerase C
MDASLPEISQALGGPFASAVSALTVGQWSAPIESAYGWHLVRVLAKEEARPSTFEEARGDVLEHYSVFRRQEAIAQYLSQAFSKYRIEVDGRAVPPPTPSRRLALRGLPSGED